MFILLWKPLHLIHNHTTDDDIFDIREKAEKFDAETHVAFFKKIFKRLGVKEMKRFALA